MSRIQPAMADGRCMTNYLAACQYDHIIQRKYNVPNNANFRSFLQKNSEAAYVESCKLHVCGLNPRFTMTTTAGGAPVRSIELNPKWSRAQKKENTKRPKHYTQPPSSSMTPHSMQAM